MSGIILTIEAKDIDLSSKQLGFHFTNIDTRENTISTEGIIGKIGDNSRGGLGKEAIPKPFISIGLQGILQTFNRTLNIPFENPLEDFRDKEHEQYLPESTKRKSGKTIMTTKEAFQFLKRYFLANTYLVFEAGQTQYENEITQEQLDEINEKIKELDEYQSIQNLEVLGDEEILKRHRGMNSIGIRYDTVGLINSIRGKMLSDGLYDEIDYNEEKLKWEIQLPNNTHTKIIETSDGPQGKPIEPQNLKRITSEGRTDAIAAVGALFARRDKSKSYALRLPHVYDIEMIEPFLEYIRFPDDLQKYEEDEFFKAVNKYRKATGKKLRVERKKSKGYELPEPQFSEEDIIYLGGNGILKIHQIADSIISERKMLGYTLPMDEIVRTAISNLNNSETSISDCISIVDSEKRERSISKDNPDLQKSEQK